MSHGASPASAIVSSRRPADRRRQSVLRKVAEVWLIMDHFHPVIPGNEAKWRHGLSLSEEEAEGTRDEAVIYSYIYWTQFPIMPRQAYLRLGQAQPAG